MDRFATLGVTRASDLAPQAMGQGADRFLPVIPELAELLPGRGLRRGSIVTVKPGYGTHTLIILMLAGASQAGSWCAAVGMPKLGLVACADMGVVLKRFAIVPRPGPQAAKIVGILLDGFDIVVWGPDASLSAAQCSRIAAYNRQRGNVLLVLDGQAATWDRPDLTLTVERSRWHGLSTDRGRLRWRELTVAAAGRTGHGPPRRVSVWPYGRPPEMRQRPSLTVVE